MMTKQYHMIPSTNLHSKFKQTLDQASTGTDMSKDFRKFWTAETSPG